MSLYPLAVVVVDFRNLDSVSLFESAPRLARLAQFLLACVPLVVIVIAIAVAKDRRRKRPPTQSLENELN